jgi:Flp pilus assembly protein TadD
MSKTLPFLSACWASARAAAAAGDRPTVLKRVAPLLADPDCPPVLQRSARRLAAKTLIAAGRYAAARSHLRAVCELAPLDATAQYDLGLAYEDDPYGCDRQAAVRFGKAVALRPTDGRFRAARGRALVRIGKLKAGVRELKEAVVASPADSVVLAVVLDGLTSAGKPRLAQRLLDRAAFLAPTSGEIRRLREKAKFAVAGGRANRPARPTGPAVLLSFTPAPTPRPLRLVGGVVRSDRVSRQGPHVTRLRAHRARP